MYLLPCLEYVGWTEHFHVIDWLQNHALNCPRYLLTDRWLWLTCLMSKSIILSRGLCSVFHFSGFWAFACEPPISICLRRRSDSIFLEMLFRMQGGFPVINAEGVF